MTAARVLVRGAVLVALFFLAPSARAYPQFVFKGYGDCGSCHHSPSGGGFPNRWGRESLGVTFGKDSSLGPLNDDYEQRFGFRYVVFVAGRSRSEIVPLLRGALEADPEEERARSLADVVAIARARARDLGLEDDLT